ncbi:hypothetical protein GCM10028895_27910 [Pontibacter rugosus]
MQQAYSLIHNGALPPAALVKAALINSADDVENPQVDFKSGYGNVDALGAVETIKQNRYFSGSVAAGATAKFILQVPEGVQQLKVTLVWHDAAASPDAPTALINDLDLRIQHVGTNQVWQPWVLNSYPHPDSLNKTATRGADHLNNVEQVTIASPTSGTYELQVEGFDLPEGQQSFYIAYEYTGGLAWLSPTSNNSLIAGSTNRIRWSSGGTGTARLAYKPHNSSTWIELSGSVDLKQPYFDWAAPDTIMMAQLRLTTNEQTLLSPEFLLAPVPKPAITLNCEGQVLLQWPALKNVTHYQVYSLQGRYMQPLQAVSDTVAILSGPEQEASYLAVAPVWANATGSRSRSVTYNPEATLCYIANFLPKQLVMDSVLFDLDLSTVYNLKEIALERFDKGTYVVVQPKALTNQTKYKLYDPAPATGINRYRARVVGLDGQVYYSQPEDVFYTQRGFVQVGPNPARAGEEVQVIAHGEGIVQLQLYNMMGQLVHSSTDGGVLKTVPTAGLAAGIYILRLQTEQGEKLVTRLLVQ